MSTLYDEDFYSWTKAQAALLRQAAKLRLNAPEGADWLNLAEEIEDLGKSRVDELYSRYVILLLHLLKWRNQPEARSSSWLGSIDEQRLRLARLVRNNPGLKPLRDREFEEAYAEAQRAASRETGLPPAFPTSAPFTRDDAERAGYLPDAWSAADRSQVDA